MGAPRGNCNACKSGSHGKKSVSWGAKHYLKVRRMRSHSNSIRKLGTRLKNDAYSKFTSSLNR
jgi:hypothetical protein